MLDLDTYHHYEGTSEKDNKAAGFLMLAGFIGGLVGLFALITHFLGG